MVAGKVVVGSNNRQDYRYRFVVDGRAMPRLRSERRPLLAAD